MISVAEAFTAAARGQPRDALRHARATLAQAGAVGIGHETLRWAWMVAARAALELRDTAAVGDLLALLDSRQPRQLAPLQQAERDLVRARLAAAEATDRTPDAMDQAPDVAAAFTAAIAGLRERSTPYHLAHGLLDQAQFLLSQGEPDAAALAVEEARDIAERLRCQPLLDRAADTMAAAPSAPS